MNLLKCENLLWEKYSEMRQALLSFHLTLTEDELNSGERKLDSSAINLGKNFSAKSELDKVRHLYSRLDSRIFHLHTCKWSRTRIDPSGWEYGFTGNWQRIFEAHAKRLYIASSTLREALDVYEGLWQASISGLFSPLDYRLGLINAEFFPHLSASDFHRFSGTDLLQFEALLPGTVSALLSDLRSSDISLTRTSAYTGATSASANRLSDFEYLKQVQLTLSIHINELRSECKHYELVSCLICDQYLGPELFENASLLLPKEICAWCLKLISPNGLSKKDLVKISLPDKQLQIEAFRLAVENFEFRYWRSPLLTTELLRALNLSKTNAKMLKSVAPILACLPRDLREFGSERHFFTETGLEELLPPDKGRGKKSISRCGHLCFSMGEREICEFLFQRGIEHSREPEYHSLVPAVSVSEFGFMRGDFLVGDVVIEYSGLSGDAVYDAKMLRKMELCQKYGISLIVVQPADLKRLDGVLSIFLRP